MTPPSFDALAAFLAGALGTAQYPPEERGGIFRAPEPAGDAGERPLTRLGIALEFLPALPAWVRRERLDALFIHRPWRLPGGALPPAVGVLYAHLPFDDHLTTSNNAPLAARLGFRSREVLGVKDGRRIGMLGDVAPASMAHWLARVREEFGGAEAASVASPGRPVSRVAVVGAMNERLVREAAERGAGLYVTGQMRQPARQAVEETGIAVVAVGHERAERWGLGALAALVRARWPGLAVVVEPARGHV